MEQTGTSNGDSHQNDGRDTRGPTDEEISSRAFELFIARGGLDGYDLEDWLAAERELRDRAGISNHPVAEEQKDQAQLPPRGKRRHEPW